jgi:glyoxylase-like metal-dependent hydrolase (beta-lactamase superfamily II)
MGIAVEDVLFCADAVFPAETLQKHGVIFCADMDAALETLARLPEMPYARFAPGHGPAYGAGEEIREICAANRARLEEIRERVRAALAHPADTDALVRSVAEGLGLRLTTATAFFLARATVLAALSSLERAGEVKAGVEENRLLWRKAV